MARSTGTVKFNFGLTSITLKLYLAASEKHVSFKQLTPDTENPVKQVLVDKDNFDDTKKSIKKRCKTFSRDECLKGYEHTKGEFVVFTDEDIANMQAGRDSLDIVEFVPLSEIDPVQIEKTHYTGPEKGSDRAYKMMYLALSEMGKAAVGTRISKGKEHLVVIAPYEHGLVMYQMYYNSEVRAFNDTCDKVDIPEAELELTKTLIDCMSNDVFDSSQYSDKFIEKVSAGVQIKLSGKEIKAPEDIKKVSENGLIDSLKATLEKQGLSKRKINTIIAKTKKAAAA